MAGSDQFAATCTAALLYTLVAKKVTVPWRATQEFAGSCLLEAFGDGFTCLLHNENGGKEGENTALRGACKGKSEKTRKDFLRSSDPSSESPVFAP